MNESQTGIAWFVVHFVLGFAVLLPPISVAVWLAIVVGAMLILAVKDRNRSGYLHVAVCYICAFEVFSRMLKAPLPWQLGTYVGIPLLLVGMLTSRSLHNLIPGLVLAALITPSLILVDYSVDIRETIVFNWSGAFVLALSVAYFNKRVLLEKNVLWMFRALAGPIVSIAVASTIKTPGISEIEFTLGSMRDTTGFGANQVATAYGLGIMIMALAFFFNKPVFGLAGIDLGVTVYIFFRALISFSRGGLVSGLVAAAGALAILIWAYYRHQEVGQTTSIRKLLLVPLLVPVLAVVFLATDQMTDGMLSLRYQGETNSTLDAGREKSLAVLTTGRSDIVKTDLQMWYDHPILGVGPGNSKELRPQYNYDKVAAHTEFSRLLAEHGLLGMVFCILIFLFPLRTVLNPRHSVIGRAILAAVALFSLTVMAHSATRLFATTFVYGIGWSLIIPRDVMLRIAARNPLIWRRLFGEKRRQEA